MSTWNKARVWRSEETPYRDRTRNNNIPPFASYHQYHSRSRYTQYQLPRRVSPNCILRTASWALSDQRQTLTMPKRGRGKEVDEYESDGGFVENDATDGGDDAPKSKKNKKTTVASVDKGAAENNFWEVYEFHNALSCHRLC